MLGILNNNLTKLDISNNALSAQQIQVMIERYLQSKLCSLVSLNLSSQRMSEENIDSLFKYVSENPTLETLYLNDCRLRDIYGPKILQGWFCPKNKANRYRGELHMEGNLFGE
jgi:Ran GTPase-activating protein (RanGAP) involved in mRNA processing and transport